MKTEEMILEIIKVNSHISRKELAAKIGLSDSSIKRRIERLTSDGRIKRVGPDKGGYWEVIEKR